MAGGFGWKFAPKKSERIRKRTFASIGPTRSRASTARLVHSSPMHARSRSVRPARAERDGAGQSSPRGRRMPLFRDTIVYLTCLHEAGHALGLPHTSDFPDIMYFFRLWRRRFREYFGRYRRKLTRPVGYRQELGNLAAGSS